MSNNPNSVVWGGGANKPLTNSLKTLPKNSNPKKIQDSKKSKLQSLQKYSKIQESKTDSKTISKIGISIIASVLLSQNLAALPAGGKFIHGSGSISKNGNTMNITGNNKNHVIAWGGGFNIAKGETVNFAKGGKAFLNLDYTNKASRILGNLNGNDNNVYLVNPSGVLIGQNASINANKFVASTSSLDKALNQFVNATTPDDKSVVNFSPVFSPNEVRGNIVNMGNITAGDIILVGKEVRNRTYVSGGDRNRNGVLGNFNHTGSLKIVGNKIFLDAEGVTKKSNIELMGFNDVLNNIADIKVQMTMDIFKNKTYTDNWIKQTYTNDGANPITNIGSIYNIITIGATKGWNDFATAWNSNSGMRRDIEESLN